MRETALFEHGQPPQEVDIMGPPLPAMDVSPREDTVVAPVDADGAVHTYLYQHIAAGLLDREERHGRMINGCVAGPVTSARFTQSIEDMELECMRWGQAFQPVIYDDVRHGGVEGGVPFAYTREGTVTVEPADGSRYQILGVDLFTAATDTRAYGDPTRLPGGYADGTKQRLFIELFKEQLEYYAGHVAGEHGMTPGSVLVSDIACLEMEESDVYYLAATFLGEPYQ